VNRLSPSVLFAPGRINNPNYRKLITPECSDFFFSRGGKGFGVYSNAAVHNHLVKKADDWKPEVMQLVRQNQVPFEGWQDYLAKRLIEEMDKPHGEGLILINPNAATEMVRSHSSLKVNPRDDAEATVIGYISARDGKLRGLLGALVVDWDGVVFELSGFTDEERQLSESSWAYANLEQRLPDDIYCLRFPKGCRVTFSYRGLTDDGKPNEAVYFRGRD
jgi:ATP-dependent DNA ligase